MEELNTRIGLRSDTLENWTTTNPTLLEGEVAVVFDGENQIFKVGNGISSFNQLPFSFYEHFSSKLINADMLKAKSVSQGYSSSANGIGGIATGYKSQVFSNFAQAHGYQAKATSDFGFVWNGDNTTGVEYSSHGVGSFSINPKDGLSGFYVGDKSLKEIISAEAPAPDLSEYAKVSVDNVPVQDLKMVHISYDQYAELVEDGNVDQHALYVLSADGYDDQYGLRIQNLGDPVDDGDAATKSYVDSYVSQRAKPLAGTSYDLSRDGEFTKMVIDVAEALGATVSSSPFAES